MTDTTTAAKLTAGARVYVTGDTPGTLGFAKTSERDFTAEVISASKDGRRVRVATDRGVIEAGGAAKVLLAPADHVTPEGGTVGEYEPPTEEKRAAEVADAQADAAAFDPPEPEEAPRVIATVTTDTAGRLTHFSTLRVERDGTVTERPVPWKVDAPAGAVAPVRLGFVLAEMGYRPAHTWRRDSDGRTWCAVVPVTPGEEV